MDEDRPQIPGGRGGTLTPFLPGELAGKPGNRKGIPNKNTRLLKDAILQAAATVGKLRIRREVRSGRVIRVEKGTGGLDGYLEHIAMHEPRAFCSLLGRILPVTIKADITEQKIYKSLDQLRKELEDRGIPIDDILARPAAMRVIPFRRPDGGGSSGNGGEPAA